MMVWQQHAGSVGSHLGQASSNLMAIVGGLRMLRMRHVSISKTAGLVVCLRLQEMASLLSCHQVHIAPCMTQL